MKNNIKLYLSWKIDFPFLKLWINNDGIINIADIANAEGIKNMPSLKKILSFLVKLLKNLTNTKFLYLT